MHAEPPRLIWAGVQTNRHPDLATQTMKHSKPFRDSSLDAVATDDGELLQEVVRDHNTKSKQVSANGDNRKQ